MIAGGGAPLHEVTDERGISLVEVLVAITLLAITMAAAASGVVRSLQLARDSRESVLGANIAQYELERVRSIPFVDWVEIAETGSGTSSDSGVGPDGQAYEVLRQAAWISAGADDDGCLSAAGGAGTGADYVRVRQVVTFPGRPTVDPVESVTVISPRLDFYDAYTGNLAVIIRDREGAPTQGHTVRIQGSAGLKVAVTDQNGCAFFPFLPVHPTNVANNQYAITVDTPGHVERRLKTQRIEDTATIGARATTMVEYEYDESVSYDPVPTYTVPAEAGCTTAPYVLGTARPTDISDPSGNAVDPEPPAYQPPSWIMQCRTSDGAVLGQATIPYNLAYTVYNPATTWSALGRVTTYPLRTHSALPDSQSRPGAEICGLYDAASACTSRVLFPYADGYSFHAGRCPMADPVRVGATQRLRMDGEPGTDYSVQVPLGLVTVRTVNTSGNTVTGVAAFQDVYADMRDPVECGVGDRIYLGRSNASGILSALVPFGGWVFHFDNPGGTMQAGATPFRCADRPINCVTVRPDATGPRATGNPAVGYSFDVRRGDRVTS